MSDLTKNFLADEQIQHDLNQIRLYCQSLKPDADQLVDVINEITKLSVQVNEIKSGVVEQESYQLFLAECTTIIFDTTLNESQQLDVLVLKWSQHNKRIFDKPIDEFFREVEYVALWRLLTLVGINCQWSEIDVRQMCKIIRRYSNMPKLWLYLHKISGDEISTAYTF